MKFTRLKTCVRNRFIKQMKDSEGSKESRQWANLFTLKLLYSLVFFIFAERIYVWWADNTLAAMPEPLVRSEQFTLSLLIHYPQYLLWAIMSGLFAVLVLHCILCCVGKLEESLYRRIIRKDSGLEPERTEVPHD
ncbi:hypothetical protein RBT00_23465 (plasmid) [Citrobacter freundii]|uniref:hypothetical protein n=1 Tax=Enterobacteriaceae TaxID=543 RepID=UPI000DEF7A97|nr:MULTISPECIES: hypothetical protein [Enterobacteriaceae]MBM7967713.1 hypothetical protein [Salmonella enterica]MDI1047283.1 hypothetical protein [Escherichia coli]HCM9668720.1 hypothetical protein [Enterobacter roggenkampii]RCL20869.1 hypothetical protein C6A40_23050 [Enterobacter sp. GER_MD16_1505_Eko_090]WME29273.1 hypothetical protein RBT00_23465 [Citrobacter freundii]